MRGSVYPRSGHGATEGSIFDPTVLIKKKRIMDHGSWIKDHGSWIKDQGSRILDLGPCFGMNDHPGRDTDVISRPSKSTIKDLSFYIGFTRIGSSIKDLGPCLRILDLVLA